MPVGGKSGNCSAEGTRLNLRTCSESFEQPLCSRRFGNLEGICGKCSGAVVFLVDLNFAE